jgi:hypothetical protein
MILAAATPPLSPPNRCGTRVAALAGRGNSQCAGVLYLSRTLVATRLQMNMQMWNLPIYAQFLGNQPFLADSRDPVPEGNARQSKGRTLRSAHSYRDELRSVVHVAVVRRH